MTFKHVNGVQYHVEKSGAGKPIVMLHGFTGSSQNWKLHQESLSQQFTVITIDLLGHGKTESPTDAARYQMDKVAEDVITIIQNLISEPVDLLGYSMGGRLALYIAINYPFLIKKLILESASPGLKTEDERQARVQSDNKLADFIEQDGIENFVQYWTNIPLFESQKQLAHEIQDQLRQQRLQSSPLGLANSLRGMGTGIQPSLWEKIPDLENISVLIIVGELDKKFVAIAEQMEIQFPMSEKVIVPHVGHTTHLEQPNVFQKIVVAFLSC